MIKNLPPQTWSGRPAFCSRPWVVGASLCRPGPGRGLPLIWKTATVTLCRLSANPRTDVALQKGIYATSPSMLGVLCPRSTARPCPPRCAGELPYSYVVLEQPPPFWPRRETTPPRFPVRRRFRGLLRRAAGGLRGSRRGQRLSAGCGLQSDLMGGAVTWMTWRELRPAFRRRRRRSTLAFPPISGGDDLPELPSLKTTVPSPSTLQGDTRHAGRPEDVTRKWPAAATDFGT
jgi:hypothetical protein